MIRLREFDLPDLSAMWPVCVVTGCDAARSAEIRHQLGLFPNFRVCGGHLLQATETGGWERVVEREREGVTA